METKTQVVNMEQLQSSLQAYYSSFIIPAGGIRGGFCCFYYSQLSSFVIHVGSTYAIVDLVNVSY